MKKSEIPVQWGDGTGKRNRRAAGKYKSRTARLRIQSPLWPNAVPTYGRLGAREQEN